MATDWIQMFIDDRYSMIKQMRENTAADVKAGYSIAQIAHQMCDIEDYERETVRLIATFKQDEKKGQILAYHHLVKVGAIA